MLRRFINESNNSCYLKVKFLGGCYGKGSGFLVIVLFYIRLYII